MLAEDTLKAMTVEFIRQLWNRTPITHIALTQLHDAWFQYWVDWKVETTSTRAASVAKPLMTPAVD